MWLNAGRGALVRSELIKNIKEHILSWVDWDFAATQLVSVFVIWHLFDQLSIDVLIGWVIILLSWYSALGRGGSMGVQCIPYTAVYWGSEGFGTGLSRVQRQRSINRQMWKNSLQFLTILWLLVSKLRIDDHLVFVKLFWLADNILSNI